MASEIVQAIKQICDEKGLSYEAVMETIESALAAAYRKDYGNKLQNIEIQFDPETRDLKVFDVKTVVEDLPEEEMEEVRRRQADAAHEREAAEAARKAGLELQETRPQEEEVIEGEEGPTFNPKTEIVLSDARVLKMSVEVGEIVRTELPVPGDFGRMAAMTAKQVITQKLREAEREIVFNEFKEQEGEVLIGTVQRREGRIVLVDVGRTVGIMLPEDQVRTERYNAGDRIKVHVREVTLGTRGPQILLSRTTEEFVRILFELEIPEIADGVVEIKGIAREAGSRSKVAVHTEDESIDPIGACIGQRGIRIQTIIAELSGEKIDIVEWNEDPKTFLVHSLAPAKIANVELDEEEKEATAYVAEDQLSLAIGKGGQNVRLAAKLAGWKLNIREDGKVEEEKTEGEEGVSTEESEVTPAEDEKKEEVPAEEEMQENDVSDEEQVIDEPESQEEGEEEAE